MALYMASLNSGSNGNCYYIANEEEAVLVDVGISCREIQRRLDRLEIPICSISAILISHEHSDHIKGLAQLVKKCAIPVYATGPTIKHLRLPDSGIDVREFNADGLLQFGKLSVTAFPKFHDAADPCSFVVESDGARVGVFTDIGFPCQHLIRHFSTCDAAFLEANYDVGMLKNSSYPFHLKKRISGGYGHLSNFQALEIFKKYRSSRLSHLLLSHLSENNNCPNLVRDLFAPHAGTTAVSVASRYEESPVFKVMPGKVATYTASKVHAAVQQLSFAF